MCLVTKTTLHKEPLLIIYTVMYYPAESGMWTLSVNWNVRTNQAKNQVLSQCTYIVHVWKWAKKSKINLKNDLILWCSFHKLQQNTKSNNFYKILVLKSCFIAKQILLLSKKYFFIHYFFVKSDLKGIFCRVYKRN